MLKKKIFFKKYKLNQLQKLKQIYKYIYFFRYHDLKINEIIDLKKKIKTLNYKSLILNQRLTTQIFSKLKAQNSSLIIYGDKDLNLIKHLNNFKKLKLIFLINQNNIFSSLKIKQLLKTNCLPFNNVIVQPFLNFIYYLRKI